MCRYGMFWNAPPHQPLATGLSDAVGKARLSSRNYFPIRETCGNKAVTAIDNVLLCPGALLLTTTTTIEVASDSRGDNFKLVGPQRFPG
ncbi:hypothetical protein N7501_005174 [Penicillium viridicatum]|nr:hypothetical protein N7501_005174 [Penicillium viridicatum]